jgi:hypothetical protein
MKNSACSAQEQTLVHPVSPADSCYGPGLYGGEGHMKTSNKTIAQSCRAGADV